MDQESTLNNQNNLNNIQTKLSNQLCTWGFGKYGQIGLKFCNYSTTPNIIEIPEFENVPDKEELFLVSSGESHSAVLSSAYRLYLFGRNVFGQLGLNNNTYVYNPTLNLISYQQKILKVSCGGEHTICLTEDYKVLTFGLNVMGQLGTGNFNSKYEPVVINSSNSEDLSNTYNINNILEEDELVKEIAAGAQHSVLLTTKGTVLSCGSNRFNSLGHSEYSTEDNKNIIESNANKITNEFSSVNIFTKIPRSRLPFRDSINQIAAGYYHTACIIDKEKIFVWGIGNIIQYAIPTLIEIENMKNHSPNRFTSTKSNLQIKDIKIGEDVILVFNKKVEIYMMGDNSLGQLGNNNLNSKYSLNFEKVNLQNVRSIEMGYNFCLAILDKGDVYGWGSNNLGQLCMTDKHIISKPTYISELSSMNITKIACGGYHCTALCSTDESTYIEKIKIYEKYLRTEKSSRSVKSNKTIKSVDKNTGTSVVGNNNDNKSDKNINPLNNSTDPIADITSLLRIQPLSSTLKNDNKIIKEKIEIYNRLINHIKNLDSNYMDKTKKLDELKKQEEELLQKKEIIRSNTKDSENNEVMEMNIGSRGFKNDFEILKTEIDFKEEFGKGTFGVVWAGRWRKELVAVKILKEDVLTQEENVKSFIEECYMLKNLRHPNILLFMGAGMKNPDYFIVTELCENGNLFELLHQRTNIPMNWEDKRRIALEVAYGINYLHSFNPPILHRDLKSMNVLLNKYYQVKIADFGSTKFLEVHMTKQKGTFQWMAPEVIRFSNYTEKADVFSFGIIMSELMNRKPPYFGVDKKQVAVKVAGSESYRPSIPNNCPAEWSKLMIKCWAHAPTNRPNFNEIIEYLNTMRL